MASHPPIPVTELADHLERLKANDNLKFSQEYEVSRKVCEPNTSVCVAVLSRAVRYRPPDNMKYMKKLIDFNNDFNTFFQD